MVRLVKQWECPEEYGPPSTYRLVIDDRGATLECLTRDALGGERWTVVCRCSKNPSRTIATLNKKGEILRILVAGLVEEEEEEEWYAWGCDSFAVGETRRGGRLPSLYVATKSQLAVLQKCNCAGIARVRPLKTPTDPKYILTLPTTDGYVHEDCYLVEAYEILEHL